MTTPAILNLRQAAELIGWKYTKLIKYVSVADSSLNIGGLSIPMINVGRGKYRYWQIKYADIAPVLDRTPAPVLPEVIPAPIEPAPRKRSNRGRGTPAFNIIRNPFGK